MTLILPLPPSDNRRLIFAPKLGRMILSSTYRKYRDEMKELVGIKMFGKKMLMATIEEPVIINITVFLENRRRDASDMLKSLLDVMSGLVFDDDKWVLPRFEAVYIDKANPRIMVKVNE